MYATPRVFSRRASEEGDAAGGAARERLECAALKMLVDKKHAARKSKKPQYRKLDRFCRTFLDVMKDESF